MLEGVADSDGSNLFRLSVLLIVFKVSTDKAKFFMRDCDWSTGGRTFASG